MRRSTVRWGFGVAIVVSVSGCASLLGDFTANGESSGDDGGPKLDGAPNTTEGSVNGDDGGPPADSSNDVTAPQDGPTTVDANEAGPIIPLACVEQLGGGRTKIGTVAAGGSNDGYRVQLFNTGSANQTTYRAYVPEDSSNGPTTYHMYSFGTGGGSNNITDIPIPLSNGNLLSVVRYPTGIAAFASASANPGGTASTLSLEVLKLDDTASAWSTPVTLTTLSVSCTNRIEGELVVNDALTNDYFGEIEYQQCSPATGTVHAAGHFQNGNGGTVFWQLPPDTIEIPDGGDAGPPVDAGPVAFDLGGLAVSGTGLYAMTNPSGNGGPDPGIGTTFFSSTTSLTSGATPYEVPLTNTTDFMQGLSMGALANTGGVGVALVEANLTTQTVTPLIYVGNVPGAKLANLIPSTDLRTTTLASISDLPINDSTYHWESFPAPNASDNLLGLGSIFPNNNGLNFLWWDGTGNVRAQRTNTTAFFYFDPTGTGLGIYGGDVTFTSPPFAAIAGFEMVYIEADPEASTDYDVWATQINCAPP